METSPRQFSFMEPERNTRMNWSGWLSLQTSVFGLILFVCIVVWALTGGTFWPIWVAMGLALPIVLQLSIREALKAPRRWRALAVQGAFSGVIVGLNVFIWALTGGAFWPIWTVLGFGLALALHAIILPRVPVRERELVERVDVLTRTRRGALDVQAAELRRIERDLHDGAQARLGALSMQIGRAEDRLEDRPEVAELLRSARAEASAAIGELRDLARGIAPPVLADRGLAAAVEALGKRSALEVTVEAQMARRLSPVIESAAYFVVAEALTNAAKHARGARARVRLTDGRGRLVIVVSDDGPG